MNKGKVFEQQFRKSVPDGVFYYRLIDSSNAWSDGNIRFAPKNICDSIMFDGERLFLLELKNHKGKSLPLSCIRANQIEGLDKYSDYKNIYPCIIINFEDVAECYCLFISQIQDFLKESDRKSIPIEYCAKNGIKIEMKKIRTNYLYDVEGYIKEVK